MRIESFDSNLRHRRYRCTDSCESSSDEAASALSTMLCCSVAIVTSSVEAMFGCSVTSAGMESMEHVVSVTASSRAMLGPPSALRLFSDCPGIIEQHLR